MSSVCECTQKIHDCFKNCSEGEASEGKINEKGLFRRYGGVQNNKKIPNSINRSQKKSLKDSKLFLKKSLIEKKKQPVHPPYFLEERQKQNFGIKNVTNETPFHHFFLNSPLQQEYKQNQSIKLPHFQNSFLGQNGKRNQRNEISFINPNKSKTKINFSFTDQAKLDFGQKEQDEVPLNNLIHKEVTHHENSGEDCLEMGLQKSFENSMQGKHSVSPTEGLFTPLKRTTNSEQNFRPFSQHHLDYHDSQKKTLNNSTTQNKEYNESEPCLINSEKQKNLYRKNSQYFFGKHSMSHSRHNSELFWNFKRVGELQSSNQGKHEHDNQYHKQYQQNLDDRQKDHHFPENTIKKCDNQQIPDSIKEQSQSHEEDQVKFNISMIAVKNLEDLNFCRRAGSIHDSSSEKDHFSDLVSLSSLSNRSHRLTRLMKLKSLGVDKKMYGDNVHFPDYSPVRRHKEALL